jgi:hypothetical protein
VSDDKIILLAVIIAVCVTIWALLRPAKDKRP